MKQTEIPFNLHLHQPYGNYPRDTFASEQAYYDAWKNVATLRLHDMLLRSPYTVNEHVTRIVASFMCWLGTNCGLSFLTSAKQLTKQFNSMDRGYYIAWALENRRESSVNSGVRTLEGITQNHCELTAADYEIIEYAVRWLATSDGQNYLKESEALIPEYKARIKMMSVLKGEYCGY